MLEHGGNLHDAITRFNRPRHDWLDLSTGINPVSYSVPVLLHDAWHRLPETNAEFITAAQSYFGVSQLLAVAGTQVAIQALPRLRNHSRVIVAAPAYAEHAYRWAQAGHDVLQVPFEALDSHVTQCDVMVVCNPNNPTGMTFGAEMLMRWADSLASRNGWLIVDEAFIDMTPAASVAAWSDHASLIVLRSIGKFFGLAGLRLGFVLANTQRLSALAEMIGPWAVSGPAQEIGKLALADVSWQVNMRKRLLAASTRLHTLLARYGINATGTALFQWWAEPQAQAFWQHMAELGVWVRLFTNDTNSIRLGLPHTEEDWLRLENALASWHLRTPTDAFCVNGEITHEENNTAMKQNLTIKFPYSTLMVQGTTSDAGKTTVVAALCRLLARQGVSVVPFKPQNMSLNSAVTLDDGEIGRAQALQALAAGLKPHTDMNPVLLKPSSDTGAQVIIQGKAHATMNARDYHQYKAVAMGAVLDSYHRLQQQYDIVLVEGAGSPAEVNLRDHDIANMGFAEAVDCPVILVSDIDRGGVFAHIFGTLACLSATEQARIIGFVINRFRGDISILKPGIDWLEAKTGKPVLAVLPFLKGLYLDAEDAVESSQSAQGKFRVVVPVFPRISNHTDFDALRANPDIDLCFVREGQPIPNADLIILPGSKNTRHDLTWLITHGWKQAIKKHLRYGGKLIGICGGFQMLGHAIADSLAVEGVAGVSEGLGVLDIETELTQEKRLLQVNGQCAFNPATVTGYEIHMGISRGDALARPAFYIGDRPEGAMSTDGQVLGTYVHGLFDHAEACNALLDWAGLQNSHGIDVAALREASLDRIATESAPLLHALVRLHENL